MNKPPPTELELSCKAAAESPKLLRDLSGGRRMTQTTPLPKYQSKLRELAEHMARKMDNNRFEYDDLGRACEVDFHISDEQEAGRWLCDNLGWADLHEFYSNDETMFDMVGIAMVGKTSVLLMQVELWRSWGASVLDEIRDQIMREKDELAQPDPCDLAKRAEGF